MAEAKSTETTAKSTQRLIKIFLAVAIGATVGWFLVETFLPMPFPHMAY